MVIKLENKKFSGEVMMDLSEELKMLTTHYLQQKYMNMALQDTTRMLLGYLSYPWQRIKINTQFIVWKQLIQSFPKKVNVRVPENNISKMSSCCCCLYFIILPFSLAFCCCCCFIIFFIFINFS